MTAGPVSVAAQVLALSLAAISPQSPTPPSPPVCSPYEIVKAAIVTVEDGQTVALSYALTTPQSFAFLESSPGTGYSWSDSKAPDRAVGVLTAEFGPPPPLPRPAGPTLQTWTFQSRAAGRTRFSLVYSRPWERGIPAARRVNVQVSVTQGCP